MASKAAVRAPQKLRAASRSKTRRKRANYRSVKIHRNLSISEAARVAGVSKGTISRWISSNALPAITDKKPFLILGGDLRDYLEARGKKGPPLELHEFYCFGCKCPKSAALGLADYVPLSAQTGNLRALCETCESTMNKVVSRSQLVSLTGILDVTVQRASEHLSDTPDPPLNDDFSEH